MEKGFLIIPTDLLSTVLTILESLFYIYFYNR